MLFHMKQLSTLSSIFKKAAQSVGLLQKNELPPTPARDPKRRTQKQRSQAAFNAMQKMEIQREFEIQQAINQPAAQTPEPVAMETQRAMKPIKTVRFKKPAENA